MTIETQLEEAIETLQKLGLKEYEARCFVGLSRLSTGTAKNLSEITDVPRTRVYDAIRVLETKGLVEVHHSSPQEFRAVSVDEAIETLQEEYESRLDRVQGALEAVEPIEKDDDSTVQEVWSISDSNAIANRTNELVESASREVVFVAGHESVVTDELCETLAAAAQEKDVIVGTVTDALTQTVHDRVPEATTFTSGLEWLGSDSGPASISRLMMVDRSAILVSSLIEETGEERAIYGEGFGNGFVVLARRLMAHGLVPRPDPEQE